MAGIDKKRLVSLLAKADETVECWEEILRLVVEAVVAHSAILFSPGLGGQPITPFAVHNFDLTRLIPLFPQVSGIGPILTQAIQSNLAPGVFADSDVVPFETFARTDYYQKIWAPMDWRDGLQFVAKPPGVSGRLVILNVRRITSQGPFGTSEKRFAAWLYPHFEGAVRRSFRLESAPAVETSIASALDGFSTGCMLVNRNGQVIFANRAAQSIAFLGDGLLLRGGMLHLSDPAAASALAGCLSAIASAGKKDISHLELVISRRSGPPLLGLISPLPQQSDQSEACAVLYLVDVLRESTVEKLERRARLLFGLTSAEANVLSLLLDGLDVDDISERRRSSTLTVRTQLKRLMQKTGLRRQRDLIRMSRLTDLIS